MEAEWCGRWSNAAGPILVGSEDKVTASLEIRDVRRDEYELLGQLMVEVYSNPDLDFAQEELPVFGFRLRLEGR